MKVHRVKELKTIGRAILITSGKGGVGKSTFTCNLAAAMASLGRKVLIVDADEGVRTLDVMLDVNESTVFDLCDILSGECSVADALIDVPFLKQSGNIKLIASSAKVGLVANNGVFKSLISQIKDSFDYVLIDSAAGVNTAFLGALSAADEALVISVNDPPAIKIAALLRLKLEQHGIHNAKLIINKFNYKQTKRKNLPSVDEIIDETLMQLIGIIPFDKNIDCVQSAVNRLKNRDMFDIVSKIAGRLEGKNIPLHLKKG